jgi:hypothetical protein
MHLILFLESVSSLVLCTFPRTGGISLLLILSCFHLSSSQPMCLNHIVRLKLPGPYKILVVSFYVELQRFNLKFFHSYFISVIVKYRDILIFTKNFI